MIDFLRRLFGFSSDRSPEEPVRFEQHIRIRARPEELFPLVDWNDERHLWRQLGHQVSQEQGQFRLRLNDLPKNRFDSRVTETAPPYLYAFESETIPMIGNLIGSHEEYRFELLDNGRTEVWLTVDARFVPDLPPRAWRFEQSKMHISCHNALKKLKLMAEQGLEAVEAAGRRLIA